jgi:hypothetical protein
MVGLSNYIRAVVLCGAAMFAASANGTAQIVRSRLQPARARAVASRPHVAGDHDDFMTLTLSGGEVNFTLIPGRASNPGNGSVGIHLLWACPCDTPKFELYAYFSSPAVALTDGAGNNIPPSAISISDNGGAFQRVSGNQPLGAPDAGLHLVSIPATGGQRGGSHTDVLNFNIDLSSGPLIHLPPGTYTGTLTIQGQAQ